MAGYRCNVCKRFVVAHEYADPVVNIKVAETTGFVTGTVTIEVVCATCNSVLRRAEFEVDQEPNLAEHVCDDPRFELESVDAVKTVEMRPPPDTPGVSWMAKFHISDFVAVIGCRTCNWKTAVHGHHEIKSSYMDATCDA